MERLELVVLALRDRRIRIVSEETGLSYQSVRNIAKGINRNPTIKTLTILEDYLGQHLTPRS